MTYNSLENIKFDKFEDNQKKKMKKTYLLSLVIIAVMTLLAACGGDKTSGKTNTPKKAVKKEMKADAPKKEAKASEKKAVVKKDDKDAIPTPPEHLEKAKEIIAAVSDSDVEAVDAKKKFKNLCAICHGTKGNMKINGAKDLTKSSISLTESVAQVYHGKGLMTPYRGILSDAEIVAVAKYTESLRK